MAPISLDELEKEKAKLLEMCAAPSSALDTYLRAHMDKSLAYSEGEIWELIKSFVKERNLKSTHGVRGTLFAYAGQNTIRPITTLEDTYYTLRE